MQLDPKLKAAVLETVEHYNDHHSDTVCFVAQALFPETTISTAQICDVSVAEIMFEVLTAQGLEKKTYEIQHPIEAREDLAARFLGIVQECRQKNHNGESTSLEKELEKTRSLPTTPLSVISSRKLTPVIQELKFSGDFSKVTYPGWDAFLYFFVPAPGESLPDNYSMAEWRSSSEPNKPSGAYYTVRDITDAEMTCWFVVHDVYGAVSDWASRAQPGDRVAAWGPRVAFEAKGDETHYYLFADETALAAAAAIMDQLPASATVTLVAEVADESGQVAVREEPHWSVTFVFRHGDEPGTSPAMIDHIGSMPKPETDDIYVYAAMETKQTSSLKSLLKGDWQLRGSQLRCVGYWRRAKSAP